MPATGLRCNTEWTLRLVFQVQHLEHLNLVSLNLSLPCWLCMSCALLHDWIHASISINAPMITCSNGPYEASMICEPVSVAWGPLVPWSGPLVPITMLRRLLAPYSLGIIDLRSPCPPVPIRWLSEVLGPWSPFRIDDLKVRFRRQWPPPPWSLLGIDELKVRLGRPRSLGAMVPIKYR